MFTTLSLFATALAAGIPFFLPWIPRASFGRRLFVLLSLLAVLAVGVALVDRGLLVEPFHLALAAGLIAFNVLLPRQPGVDPTIAAEAEGEGARSRAGSSWAGPDFWGGLAWVAWAVATICGGIGLAREGLQAAEAYGLPSVWTIAQRFSSAALLGSATVAMVLGHWYLVSRTLSFGPLRRLAFAVLLAVGLRLVILLGGVASQWDLWQGSLAGGWMRFLLEDGLFLLPRLLFGIVAPAVLGVLAWRCARIRANQSATGILYVVVAFVLIGEILAHHFLVSDERYLL